MNHLMVIKHLMINNHEYTLTNLINHRLIPFFTEFYNQINLLKLSVFNIIYGHQIRPVVQIYLT